MKLAFLIAVPITPNIFVYSSNPRSLVDTILFNTPRTNGLEWVKSVLANFCPVRGAHIASLMLQYRKFPYQEIYERIEEGSERQIQLFENLFSATNENDCHETCFSPRKLQRNHILATKIFLEVKSVVYKGRFFAPGLDFGFDDVYEENKELAMAMLCLVIKEQMGMINDLVWLDRLFRVAEEDHVHEIFKLLCDHHEMTPEVLASFMKHWNETKRKSLVSLYLYPSEALPREERLMRCALLMSSVQPLEIYAKCKELWPHNNWDEFRKIALDHKDRQSISTLYYWNFQYLRNRDSRILEYVKLGRLSPLTTKRFIEWVSDTMGARFDFGDWPLEHLLLRLPLASLQVSEEDCLSAWLCSDALMYENVNSVSLDKIYDTDSKVSINMRLTEPVKMKGDRVVTRAAEYFILNAQAILDIYQSDQQALEVSIENSRKILAGVLYALAEGRHLDFSSTVLEMPEGNERWIWLEYFAEYDNYEYAAVTAMRYLKSGEIYEYVHRAPLKQRLEAELAKEITEDIAGLSVN